jgi:hypothetical protein
MNPTRMVIYTKDIQRITGKSDSYSRKIIRVIRKKLGKQKHQPISITEFCHYLNLPIEEVLRHITN